MAELKGIEFTKIGTGDLMVPANVHGRLEKKFDKYEASGALSLNDTISMFKIPVDARIFSMKISADDLGTTGDLDIGFYKLNGRDGIGDAVDADALSATAIDVNAAAIDNTELVDIDNKGKTAWEIAGLSAKPAYGEFIVVITVAAATTAGGTIVLEADISKE